MGDFGGLVRIRLDSNILLDKQCKLMFNRRRIDCVNIVIAYFVNGGGDQALKLTC